LSKPGADWYERRASSRSFAKYSFFLSSGLSSDEDDDEDDEFADDVITFVAA
jgi:hypothetical protein